MKNNIDYFRHENNSHNHWKFKVLRKRYGWAGDGKFWALNGMIADSENCLLNLSSEEKKTAVAIELDFDLVQIDAFLNYLSTNCRLVKLVDVDTYTTDIVQEIFLEISAKRNRQKDWIKDKRSTSTNEMSTQTHKMSTQTNAKSNIDFEQSKVKYSKKEREEERENPLANNLAESNLFRKPVIPTKQDVERTFLQQGGTKEMAEKFYADKQGTGWFFKGSPITDFGFLVSGFITNWKANDLKRSKNGQMKSNPKIKL